MRAILAIMLFGVAAGVCPAGENLCVNGTFDAEGNALLGWITNYRWMDNKNYLENYRRISVISEDGLKRGVLRMDAQPETLLDSRPIPFVKGGRYRCNLDLRGGKARVYMAGYKWKPGIRPHATPKLGELRLVYKSKPFVGTAKTWKNVTLHLPGKKPSKLAQQHLDKVRFITVHVWAEGEVFIDNVEVRKL